MRVERFRCETYRYSQFEFEYESTPLLTAFGIRIESGIGLKYQNWIGHSESWIGRRLHHSADERPALIYVNQGRVLAGERENPSARFSNEKQESTRSSDKEHMGKEETTPR